MPVSAGSGVIAVVEPTGAVVVTGKHAVVINAKQTKLNNRTIPMTRSFWPAASFGCDLGGSGAACRMAFRPPHAAFIVHIPSPEPE
jgi:hypothetical protein